VKPTGAYRPPGARGLATPSIYKREDEGGAPRQPTSAHASGTTTPIKGANLRGLPPGAVGYGQPANGNGSNGRRHLPGPSASDPADKKNRKRKGGKKENAENGDGGESAIAPPLNNHTVRKEANGEPAEPIETPSSPVPVNSPQDGVLDATAKKIRNLNKKLKAIEELKEKAKRGERLEATQVRKIEGETEIRKELASLGVDAGQ